jgi:DNA-directed RNA polymerase specialized sigma24 family protein
MFRNVRSFIVRRGIGPDEADDIIQEAFARLEAYTRAKEVCSQEAFLMRTALNLMRDRARRQRTAPFDSVTLDLETVADASPQPDEIVRGYSKWARPLGGRLQQPRHRLGQSMKWASTPLQGIESPS